MESVLYLEEVDQKRVSCEKFKEIIFLIEVNEKRVSCEKFYKSFDIADVCW